MDTNMDNLLKLVLLVFLILIVSTSGSDQSNVLTLAPSSDEISHFVNSSFIIFCRSNNTDLKPQWKGPLGIEIDNYKGRVHIEENPGQLALVFEHIDVIDRGTWACRTTESDNDYYQKSFQLLVNQKISFEETEQVQSVMENRDATVSCKVRGDPKPTISWYRNGDPIKFPSTKFKQLSDGLFIKSVTETDDGEYTCRAFQISETVTDVQDKTILLRIQKKPHWSSNETINNYYAYLGGFVNLSCEAIAEPPASFTWIYDNKAISSNIKSDYRIFYELHSSVLEINVRNENQFGEYKCKVANPLGHLERTIRLKRGHKPVAPSKFQLRRVFSDAFELDIRSVKYTDIPENMNTMGYRVEYMSENEFKYAAGNWTFAARTDFNFVRGVRFVVNGLNKNTTYYMRAACMNLAGLSDWTKVSIFTTLANGAAKTIVFTTNMSIILSMVLIYNYFKM
ncbi:neural cell adhesion molecule 2 [Episyrphus balteatus]|uniref:neural cell adhesion molecule 2 n=1 Tax=Episyrphus balteatus TaxID=286459 RepID=UPI002485E887|nr:neural cell adhesion molecule 2 [Episyrphus balteatus]